MRAAFGTFVTSVYTKAMHYVQKYIGYVKDNPQGYWFKRKVYGWGWVPATWQGWTTLFVFILILTFFIIPLASKAEPSSRDIVWFFVKGVAWAIALVVVCFRTGERPKWQWGLPKKQ
jgi:uncharacterized membrane protein